MSLSKIILFFAFAAFNLTAAVKRATVDLAKCSFTEAEAAVSGIEDIG